MNFLSQIFGFFKSFQCWVTIAPWEMGLRIRLGKTATVLQPGPHWRIPFLDRIFVQPVRLRTISDGGQTISTSDGKNLSINFSVMYQIQDIKKLHMTTASPEHALLNEIRGIITSVVNKLKSTEITPELLQQSIPSTIGDCWGLSDVRLVLATFAFVRAIRLMQYEYQQTSTTNNLNSTTDVQV